MSTATTEDRAEAPDPRDDWPEGYREWLSELPDDVEHELSDLLDAMEGIKSLADTAILIHQNAEGGPVGNPEPGELEHRKARLISPMREDAARAVWALYRRLDDFFGLWREYSVAADRGAFRLASEAENGDGPGAGADVSVERLFDVLNVARGCLELAADAELENSYGVSPRTMFGAVCEYLRPAYDDTLEALGRDPEEELGIASNTLEALAGEVEGDGNGGDPSKVDVDALYEIAVLAQYALGTAADGELEDLTGVSPRKVFAALSEHLDAAVKDAGRLLNRDEDAVLDAAAERVRELAGGE